MDYIGLSGSFDLMKNLNLEKVFKLILLHHPISRSKISQLSGLNKVTVSSCVDFLMQNGIIQELGITGAIRGRPPTLIGLNGDSGAFIGIDTDTSVTRVLVTNLAGKELERNTMVNSGSDPKSFIDLLSKTVIELMEKYSHYRLGVIGGGIAVPGYYNQINGTIEYLAYSQIWNGFPVRKEIEQLDLGIPIYIQSGSMAGVMGEIHFGKSNPSEHLAYINGTWGLILGLYTKGETFSGHSGFAGRIGHTVVHPNGKKCICGNKGCLEAYASLRSLFEKLYPNKTFEDKYFIEIMDKYKQNDPTTVASVHELTQYLTLGLVNIINHYNPSQVCIGGRLGLLLNDNLINQIKASIDQMVPEHFRRKLDIYSSDLGELCIAYGCISIVRDNLIDILVNSKNRTSNYTS